MKAEAPAGQSLQHFEGEARLASDSIEPLGRATSFWSMYFILYRISRNFVLVLLNIIVNVVRGAMPIPTPLAEANSM